MKVLAFDTALSGCSAALYDTETERCVSDCKIMARGQAEILVPMVQEVLEKGSAAFADVDLLAVTVGPGAFTGLRIGLATARGFGLVLQKPVVGLTTLDILAAMFFRKDVLEEDHLLCVLIETKRKDYYCQYFQAGGMAYTKPQALSEQEIKDKDGGNVIYIGDALARFSSPDTRGCKGYELPDPCIMAQMALASFETGNLIPPEPLYLRDADVSVSKKEQRIIGQILTQEI
ncbi:MAG: tRNA (adenosine(37)-N6)-threonylcarbamoyltransferase complex dimerization subunit type 1 TsaB [Alphaproteobacteria bacterium CG_4_9_14_3_um_filter_47_13]|nr:MAG: tRNA (adenosine(37)-N6)-threonylcarbamoyltransferase complex dimerization subunit type 1 TsaB [Alphaproteobacteria bacterium CG_4_9_14_3_um_filter_47_13]